MPAMEMEQIQEAKKGMKRIELREAPFVITGLPWVYERNSYDRIPADLMPKEATDLFKEIGAECTGGLARIRTNSDIVLFEGKVRQVKEGLYHMSRVGRSGFDFHMKGEDGELRFVHTSVPYDYGSTSVSCEIAVRKDGLYDENMRTDELKTFYDLYIVLPTYNAVDEACIYVEADAEVLLPSPRSYDKQVLFYGSSITQGACASRPSLCYTNRLALGLDCPIIDFGFGGHAMAEPEMADLIVKQTMDVFVMDYDHNAPTVKYLQETHEPFFKRIRKARPELPIIMATKPDYNMSLDDNDARREIIRTTYENAKRSGDTNVYFVDGKYYFEGVRDQATVDTVHPTDLGFDRMYQTMYPLVKALLDEDKETAKKWQP